MGFFARRTAEKTGRYAIRQNTMVIDSQRVIWQPEAQEIEACPAYLMEDEAAGDHAFGARFCSEQARGSSLTIWAFPAECGPKVPGFWFVGYKTEYEWHGDTDGRTSLYHGDLYLAQWYDNLTEATNAARTAASALVCAGPGAAWQHVAPEVLAAWFEWDGQPW